MNKQINIGSKVAFLNEKGFGIIKKIDNKIAIVEIDKHLEIPYPIKELVAISEETVQNNYTQNSINNIIIKYTLENNIFKIFITNQSELSIFAVVNSTILTNPWTQTIEAGSTAEIISQPSTDNNAILNFQLLPYQKSKQELFKLIEKTFSVSELLNKSIINLTIEPSILSNNKTIMTKAAVANTFISKNVQKDNQPQVKNISRPSKNKNEPVVEVDLHMEELIDENFNGTLSNADILNIQLKHFKHKLRQAMKNRLSKIIFIHGVGNGRLKQEITNILNNYPNITYHDAPFKRYGRGATEVLIYYN